MVGYKGSCYLVSTGGRDNHYAARRNCQRAGASLLTFSSDNTEARDEMTWVGQTLDAAFLSTGIKNWYIGKWV